MKINRPGAFKVRPNFAGLVVMLLSLLFSMVSSPAKDASPRLFIPDGQLLSHTIQVYVSATNLDESMEPSLRLIEFYSNNQADNSNTNEWQPTFIAGGQSWSETVGGKPTSFQGTFMLFNLRDYPLAAYKSTTRLTPVLTWNGTTNGGPRMMVVGTPVYLGKRWMAAGWTLLAVGALGGLIIGLCRTKTGEKKNIVGVLSLISGPDNYLSLWRTQLAAWTLAVGAMVFFFGVIQLQVPKIPDQLVALMGMSVVTGGLSAMATRSQRKVHARADEDAGPKKNHRPEFSDLVSSYNPGVKAVVLSISKAQMLFWTGIILILFVAKSLLTGELWEVPWELVALTGVSQAGYVSDKALDGKTVDHETAAGKK